jgi:hypothetical protein
MRTKADPNPNAGEHEEEDEQERQVGSKGLAGVLVSRGLLHAREAAPTAHGSRLSYALGLRLGIDAVKLLIVHLLDGRYRLSRSGRSSARG